ncbi:hypothetical protein CCZ20_27495 [Priestia aryabhattai]|uniref:hypothetical protein n=1 Tax=Priestia aryabhattai TaxID=412384 RepID=UPI000B513F87|nr:hypothetical protein [Priestia aryabhattai]OVE34252.1 hypothetical protein CCZ20_27495 [Priestia aryabhattai]
MAKESIKAVKENIDAANGIASSIQELITMDLDSYRSAKSKVFNNGNLSADGKRKQYDIIKSNYERQFLTLAKTLKDTYHSHLKDAKELAEKVMIADVPETSSLKRKLFDQKAEALKAKVTFSLNADDAKQALREFVSIADEPELALEAKSQLMHLSQQVMSLTTNERDSLAARQALGQMYNELSQKAMTEEGREASEALENMNRMESVTLFSPLVTGAIQEVSVEAARYMNDPDAYFKLESQEGGDEE